MNSNKSIHYGLAGASFLIAFIVYFITMQPTVPFWDCGEFASAAWALQVPHPPGAPLWTLIGHVAMLLPTSADLVARYNLFSVLFASATIMMLYLTTVRLIGFWRKEITSKTDILTTYGGAFVAAMSLTFTDSFWFNALECEVYSITSFVIALILWLVLVWYDHADDESSEKYLMLISYLMGIAMGVHQLIVLMVFTCVMLIYYRRRKNVTVSSWLMTAAISLVAFVIIYKFVLSGIAGLLASAPILVVGIFVLMIAGIWYSHKTKNAILNMSLWSVLLIVIGYSTYTTVIIRAKQHLPMNQNAPNDFAAMKHYLGRDQYGDRGFFPRRSLDEFGQKTGPTWDANKYSSDLDFFWKFQIDHMSNRYLYWNYIGRLDDKQDAGTDWSKTWGIPFFLGLLGMVWHFRRDPKRALSIAMMFITMGLVAALFQNSQDPSARERDYFYVGSYYIFSIWLGIGATALMEIFRVKKKVPDDETFVEDEPQWRNILNTIPYANEGSLKKTAYVLGFVLLLAPINQCIGLAGLAAGQQFSRCSKWAEYSRKGNYVPFDCAYNILQSCDKDAILFTYGDNDTFPLWCLQDVYGIRRDIRIVMLSLSNVSWYIDQLKNEQPWGAKKIILQNNEFSDKKLQENIHSNDPFALKAETEFAKVVSIPLTAETVRSITNDPNREAADLTWKYLGSYDDKDKFIYTTADQLSYDIIKSNINSRPIYYSVTIAENFRIGLDQNLSAEGLAWRVTPDVFVKDNSGYGGQINEKRLREYLFNAPKEAAKEPRRGALIRTFSDLDAGIGYIDKNFAFNYLMAYMRYTEWMLKKGNTAEASRTLDMMEKRLPPVTTLSDVYPADIIADLYQRAGNEKKAKEYAQYGVVLLQVPGGAGEFMSSKLQRKYRLGNLYMLMNDIDDAKKVYQELRSATQDQSIIVQMNLRLMEVEGRQLELDNKRADALKKYEEVLRLKNMPDEQLPPDFKPLLLRRNLLRQALAADSAKKLNQ